MALQLALPLQEDSRKDAPLRQAWMRSGLALPYALALQDRAITMAPVETAPDAPQDFARSGFDPDVVPDLPKQPVEA